MKKIIVCCDGTWNTENDTDHGRPIPTNVAKVARSILPRDANGNAQVVTYIDGVGTQFGFFFRGGALGRGLFRNVLEAYRAICFQFEHGDQIYLFGFSRGAFTVRSLAGLIRNSGILHNGTPELEEAAIALYRDYSPETSPDGHVSVGFRHVHSYSAGIHFMGVWDTVGSLGIPGMDGRFRIFKGLDWQFHDTKLSRTVRNAYHALAIHERRTEFVPSIWEQHPEAPGDQVSEQVWFSGAHADVGGGYFAEEAGLSDIALKWMIEKAELCGLEFDHTVLKTKYNFRPDPLALIHETFRGGFKFLSMVKGFRTGTPRVFSEGERIHPSVWERFPAGNWPESFRRALQKGVQL